jgi:hypothetical protein
MLPFIGALICFFGMTGFGLSTNIYADFLGLSKLANDRISIISGLLLALLALYISYP